MRILSRLLPLLALLTLPVQLPAAPLPVFASIAPVQYLVDRIGGDAVRSDVLVPPGQTPHTFSPTPKILTALAEAKLLFRTGSPGETAWLKKVERNYPQLQIVDLSQVVTQLSDTAEPLVGEPETETAGLQHDAHEHHGHQHGDSDPHFWTSPLQFAKAAKAVSDALVLSDPANAAQYVQRYTTLAAELTDLDQALDAVLKPLKKRDFLVFHPSWGYFAARYGLRQLSVETNGKMPAAKTLLTLIEHARKANIGALFVQPQINPADARLLATQIGAKLVIIDPLAYDYQNNLRAVSKALSQAAQ